MSNDLRADICVIGAGSAGLSVASGAAQLGAKTVLIERGEMGGECLNTGCVPSKALLAAAKTAKITTRGKEFGVDAEPRIDFGRVHRHVQQVIAAIAPHDSVDRFNSLGVEVVRAEARFTGPRHLQAGNRAIHARRIVIATGSRPALPPIEGLDSVPFFTNETIFANTELPDHLVIIGGGPIGMELAQAHRRLGSEVTVLETATPMAKDDPELARDLCALLDAEGVTIRSGVKVRQLRPRADRIEVTLSENGRPSRIEASHLLVAAGRRPNLESLDLGTAGVRHHEKGIIVDRRLQTTASGVYAIGDVIGGPQFTHVAGYHAGIIIRNALFRLPAKVDYASLPWVTYTDPELAQAGITESQARRSHGDAVRVVRVEFKENDRAQAERATVGRAKIIALPNGRVVGASILGPSAGELIHLWVLAIQQRLRLKDIARMIAPYPTLGEIGKAAAAEFYKPKLFGSFTRRAVRWLSWLP